jgi:hypothetical protein
MGAFNQVQPHKDIDVSRARDDGTAPGGINNMNGVYYKADYGSYRYSARTDVGNSGWEIEFLPFRYNTGSFGLGIGAHWQLTDFSHAEEEWCIAAVYKRGKPDGSLPWNVANPNMRYCGMRTPTNLADTSEILDIEFECPGGNFSITITADLIRR